MGFKLNIGKDGGGGSTGFSLKQSLNMIKAKAMSSQMVGTDVMKDGYYNTVNESGAGSPATRREKTASEIKKRGVDLRTGGQLVPTRGDLTPEQNREVLKKSIPEDINSGKRRKWTEQDKAQMANTGNLLGSAQAATNELERTGRRGGKEK
jgi:hypothetical protein